jgi:hypothetical protein
VDNPWLQLPASPPFVLPADRPHIEAFNNRLRPNQERCRLDLSLYPAPWMGNPQAPLVVWPNSGKMAHVACEIDARRQNRGARG